MKTILLLFVIVLFCFVSVAQSGSPVVIHRVQDTTKDKSGLYFGKSTEGNFSVLLPIPFNDFTIEGAEVDIYSIGSKSQEGIKFSVTEIENRNKNFDLNEFPRMFDDPGDTVENIKREKTKDAESISFSVFDKFQGAIIKQVLSRNRVFLMIIEFPIEFREMVESDFGYFFSSLNIIAQ